jgi:hypothetical protein
MQPILALDYSTHAGYAFFYQDGRLAEYGTLYCDIFLKDGKYPFNYVDVAERQAELLCQKIYSIKTFDECPKVIVIEETNGSKNRYTQKLLEFLHMALLRRLKLITTNVVYVNTVDWRKNLGILLTKEQRDSNKKLSKEKSKFKKRLGRAPTPKELAALKKKLGIKGKFDKKHAAIDYVNKRFGLDIRKKDNDAAEAICIGLAYMNNVSHCNGE